MSAYPEILCFPCVEGVLPPSAAHTPSISRLPRLRRLALHGRSQTAEHAAHFLENHGPKIEELELAYFPTEVIFESCVHMKRLRIEADRPVSPCPYTLYNSVLIVLLARRYSPKITRPVSGRLRRLRW